MTKYVNKGEKEAKKQVVAEAQKFHEKFIADLEKENARNLAAQIKDFKDKHEEQKVKDSAVTEYDVKQNKKKEPLTLSNGVIVLPGGYYVEDAPAPFAISEEEFARNYVEAGK
jgi:uridine kinase